MRKIPVYLVNAFIKENSGGSPTSVVLNASGLTDLQMQDIAKQAGTSHTAFVFEPGAHDQAVVIRFFTPGAEILNCGHGTIAAHYARVRHFNIVGSCTLFQQVKEGLQQIEIVETERETQVFLHQNEIRFLSVENDIKKDLLSALNIDTNQLIADLPVILASPGANRFLMGIKSLEVLNSIEPDFATLKNICSNHQSIGCFIYMVEQFQPVFSASARMFAPNIGVNEDVINGNSSGCLGEYLLRIYGKANLVLLVNQGQKLNRSGQVMVRSNKTADRYQTLIGGSAEIAGQFEIVIDSFS